MSNQISSSGYYKYLSISILQIPHHKHDVKHKPSDGQSVDEVHLHPCHVKILRTIARKANRLVIVFVKNADREMWLIQYCRSFLFVISLWSLLMDAPSTRLALLDLLWFRGPLTIIGYSGWVCPFCLHALCPTQNTVSCSLVKLSDHILCGRCLCYMFQNLLKSFCVMGRLTPDLVCASCLAHRCIHDVAFSFVMFKEQHWYFILRIYMIIYNNAKIL